MDRDLAIVQLREGLRVEAPLDFRVAGKRACAGAGDIGEGAIELVGNGHVRDVGYDGLDLVPGWTHEFLQQTCAMRMNFDGGDLCCWILIGDG